jgi:hypothetical protein
LSTSLKMLIGMLVAGLAMATLAALPAMAEAQTVDEPSTVDQNANQNTHEYTAASTATTIRSAPEPAAGRRLVKPGESLWSIAQERLGPNAAPERVADEVGRIHGSNRDRIGGDPNLILAGQELSLPPAAVDEPTPVRLGLPAAEPAAVEPAAAKPAAAEPVVLPELPERAELVVASVKKPTPAEQNADARRTAGYVVLLVTFAVAVLGTWRLVAKRH